MTKKLLGLLFVTLVFSLVANASTATQYCGGDSLTNTATGFPDPYLVNAPVTCAAFTVPTGYTLTSVDITINNDLSSPNGNTTDTVTYTYAVTGFGSLSQVNSTSTGTSVFPAFTNVGGSCSTPGTFGNATATDCADGTPGTNTTAGVFNAVNLSISATWTAGGLQSNGAETINISEYFTYSATPGTPEPATLLMTGGGLIALAIVARRRRRA